MITSNELLESVVNVLQTATSIVDLNYTWGDALDKAIQGEKVDVNIESNKFSFQPLHSDKKEKIIGALIQATQGSLFFLCLYLKC
jgi:hypothetical protein